MRDEKLRLVDRELGLPACSAGTLHPTPYTSHPPLVIADGLTKVYRRGAEVVRALDGVSFELAVGEFAAVVGPSGAGKTTLLHMLGCMDRPTAGRLVLDGCPVDRMSEAELTRTRQQRVGFIFQHFGLVPTLTVAENVGLPNMFAARPLSRPSARERADALLDRVGLRRRREHRPHQLSGGEMQRVAIARALMNSPRLLLADEPTGNLDSGTAAEVVSLLRDLHRDGLTVVVVTHNEALADLAARRLVMADGRLCSGVQAFRRSGVQEELPRDLNARTPERLNA